MKCAVKLKDRDRINVFDACELVEEDGVLKAIKEDDTLVAFFKADCVEYAYITNPKGDDASD